MLRRLTSQNYGNQVGDNFCQAASYFQQPCLLLMKTTWNKGVQLAAKHRSSLFFTEGKSC